MSKDHGLLNEDPMMAPEIAHMLGDAELFLQSCLDGCFSPKIEASQWFHGGRSRAFASSSQFRNFLSEVTRANFSSTPVILNDMFVRRRLRANLVNSRKKLVLAILDNAGLPGFSLEGSTPDVSICRTMLIHTGLYVPTQDDESATWRFASTEEIVTDRGLREVWGIIRDFFTIPSTKAKSVELLFESLKKPPFGVREALLPVFFAAGLKAFPSALTVARKNEYLPDILSSTVEDILRTPADFSVHVHELTLQERQYVKAVIDLFGGASERRGIENDILRELFDTLTTWKSAAGPAALESRKLSPTTITVQKCLVREPNPFQLLFAVLPRDLGTKVFPDILATLEKAKAEMEGVKGDYYAASLECLARALELPGPASVEPSKLLESAADWARPIAADIMKKLSDQVTKGFLTRLTMYYADPDALIDSLASVMVGKGVARWDDGSLAKFRAEVTAAVARIEDAILVESSKVLADPALAASIVQRKARNLYQQLVELVGPEHAKQSWNDFTKES